MDCSEAMSFIQSLHGDLDARRDGSVAYVLRHHRSSRPRNLMGPPGSLLEALRRLENNWHIWRSVPTYLERRAKANALVVPALWCDVDPPHEISAERLRHWRKLAYERLTGCLPPPSMVVDSGRGLHAYWLLRPPVRLEGPDRERLADGVVSANRSLAVLLDGDNVSDLARVMRLPGSVNPKNGAPCRLLEDGGPRYRFEDLHQRLARLVPDVPKTERARRPRPEKVSTLVLPSPDVPVKRGRGRPPKAVTVRQLRKTASDPNVSEPDRQRARKKLSKYRKLLMAQSAEALNGGSKTNLREA